MVEAMVSREKYDRDLGRISEQNVALQGQVKKLQDQLHAILKLWKSGKSERRPLSINPGQSQLFDLPAEVEQAVVEESQKPKTTPRKRRASKPQGSINLPDSLERREETHEPDLDPNFEWEQIGVQRTEILEREPGQLYVRVILRPKYKKVKPQTADQKCQIEVAPLPERALPNSYVGSGLLAWLIAGKLVDHLPFYRQIKKVERETGVALPKSTVNDWFSGACTLIKPLYDCLVRITLLSDIIQGDESRIEVLTTIAKDKDGNLKLQHKKGKATTVKIRRGWMWVIHDPLTGNVVFNFESGRGKAAANQLLGDYEGYLQVDGYAGYKDLLAKRAVTYVACLVHIRRKFHEALGNDRKRATKGVDFISRMYAVEKETITMTPEERCIRRKERLAPILEEYKSWLLEQRREVTPKSKIGKAITYALNRHEGVMSILKDGRLKLDNNLIENLIRPLALGRKNYLFAGSDAGAQRLAIMYSLLGTCKAKGVNPLKWLAKVLDLLPTAKVNDLEKLLPGNLKLD